jgi:hypothetical protein
VAVTGTPPQSLPDAERYETPVGPKKDVKPLDPPLPDGGYLRLGEQCIVID